MTDAPAAGIDARRNRVTTIGAVASYLVVTALLVPDREVRARLHAVFVLTLGYGHLIGAATFSLARTRASRRAGGAGGRSDPRTGAWRVVAVLLALALPLAPGAAVLGGDAWVTLALLAAATWHTVENELVLKETCLARGRVPRLARTAGPHGRALALTAIVLSLATASLSPHELGPVLTRLRPAGLDWSAWLGFGDVFAATTLHHLASWLVLFRDRVRVGAVQGGDRAHFVFVHAIPALACTGLLLVADPRVAPLREAVFSPTLYLYWSTLHVIQTVVARERRGAPPNDGRSGGAAG